MRYRYRYSIKRGEIRGFRFKRDQSEWGRPVIKTAIKLSGDPIKHLGEFWGLVPISERAVVVRICQKNSGYQPFYT